MIKIGIGDTLTIDQELIGNDGSVTFREGDEVIVRELYTTKAHWSNFFNMWIDDKLDGVKLEGHYGIFFPHAFKELKNFPGINLD